MSKVYSRFEHPEKEATNSGNKERELFRWTKDEYGQERLEPDGTEDIQAKIESYADECDIKNIVARAAFDPVFAQSLADGVYSDTEQAIADITDYPENIHELKKMADAAGKTIDEIYNQMEAEKQKQTEQKQTEEKEIGKDEQK